MRPRKERLPCGISKLCLKRAYPEGQEDESLLVESPGSLRVPSSLNSPDEEVGGRGDIEQGEDTGDLAFPVPLSCPPPPRKQSRCPLLKSSGPTQEFWDLTKSAGCSFLKTNKQTNKNFSPKFSFAMNRCQGFFHNPVTILFRFKHLNPEVELLGFDFLAHVILERYLNFYTSVSSCVK